METHPLVVAPKGIIGIAPGVFRNLDTGITWSIRSRVKCHAMREGKINERLICNRRAHHRGTHMHRAHIAGVWVRTRWGDGENAEWIPVKARPVNCDPFAPRRELSIETKQSMRRKAARRRALRVSPMFAEQEIDKVFARQPDYYGGIRP